MKIKDDGWNPNYFKEATGYDLYSLWLSYQATLPINLDDDVGFIEFPDVEHVHYNDEPDDSLKLETAFFFEDTCPDHPGALLFDQVIDDPCKLLKELSVKVIISLYSSPPQMYPSFIRQITLKLVDMPGVAHCQGPAKIKEIHFSVNYINENFTQNGLNGDLLTKEIQGVLV